MTENKDKKVFLAGRVPASLKRELDMKLADQQRDYAPLLIEWVRSYLGGAWASPEYSGTTRDWHDKLETVLTKGSERDIIGIQANLDWAVQSLQPATDEELSPEEHRIVEGYRGSTWEKRRRILAQAVKAEDLEPELMPEKTKKSATLTHPAKVGGSRR